MSKKHLQVYKEDHEEFKRLAKEHDKKMAALFKEMVTEYKKLLFMRGN